MIELRLLRYFLVVADTEHVGRAAVRLHISQSPLSRQIRQLEDRLGVQLFERNHRRIQLTAAGRWLVEPAREILARADSLARDVKHLGEGETGQIAIGFVGAALSSGLLPATLRTLRSERPNVRILLRHLPSLEQLTRLGAGELDLALTHRLPRSPELVVHRLSRQPFVLAVPRPGPLTRGTIRPAELDGQPWIAIASDDSEGNRDRWAAAGFLPNIVVQVTSWANALALVDAGTGLALVPESYAAGAPAHVAIRRLPWLRLWSHLVLVRRRASSPLIDDVTRWIVEATRTAPPSARALRDS
jgi:DNA-binding transcriptional LysR family regulator